MTETKRCPQCGEDKCPDAFGRNKGCKDGCSFYCKLCMRAKKKARYDARLDMPGRTVNCVHCNQPFTYYAPKHQTRRFCTRRCFGDSRKVAPPIRICQECGKEFPLHYSPKQDYKGWFCSIHCSRPHLTQARRGKANPPEAQARARETFARNHARDPFHGTQSRYGPPLPPKPCAQCNLLFGRAPGEKIDRWIARRFCSVACWYEYLRAHPDASPRWTGGRFPYYGPNWRDQARKARKRDKYTCQDCGLVQQSPSLDVHHIVKRREFGEDFIAANDLSNLATLCKPCHTIRDKTRTKVLDVP